MRRPPEGRGAPEEPLLSLPVRGQQLPRAHGLRVAAGVRAGLRRGAQLHHLRSGGRGRLRLRLHRALQRIRRQLAPTWPLLWLRGEDFKLSVVCFVVLRQLALMGTGGESIGANVALVKTSYETKFFTSN